MDKHFPVLTENLPAWKAVARCGYVSNNPKEFVDPRNYKPQQVTCALCKPLEIGNPVFFGYLPDDEPPGESNDEV